MEFKLLHLYPDLMNLYGSYGNLLAIERMLGRLGHSAKIIRVLPGEKPDFKADFVFIGAGTERSQKAALESLEPFRNELSAAASAGMAALFAGNSMELLGQSITDRGGKQYKALGLAGFDSVQGAKRIVEDVYGHSALFDSPVVGFINKNGLVSGVDSPLLTSCEIGFGNDAEGAPEGYASGGIIASQLTGPLLVKNPPLLEWVINTMLKNRGTPQASEFPHTADEAAAYQTTCRELLRRIKK